MGTEPSLSGVLYGGQNQTGIDLDAQLPVNGALGVAAGASFNRFTDFPNGDHAHYLDIGVSPVWRPREGTEIRGYYGVQISPGDRSTPFTFVDGDELPPDIPNDFLGQKWAAWKNRFYTMGLLGRTTFGDWRLSAGVFRHRCTDTGVNHPRRAVWGRDLY